MLTVPWWVVFFDTSHCLFPILNENSYLPCLIGTGPGACIERDQGCGCLGRMLQKGGSIHSCLQPLWSMHWFHHHCLQAVLKRGRSSHKDSLRLLWLQAGGGWVGWRVPLLGGRQPETMTGRLIWLWCCSVLLALGLCPFSPLQE